MPFAMAPEEESYRYYVCRMFRTLLADNFQRFFSFMS